MAHPPREKPLLRSSSVVPPFPCITPSTVTCVTVVSFIPRCPSPIGRPCWAAAHPCYEHHIPDPTPPRGSLPRTAWCGGLGDATARRLEKDRLQALVRARCGRSLAPGRRGDRWSPWCSRRDGVGVDLGPDVQR